MSAPLLTDGDRGNGKGRDADWQFHCDCRPGAICDGHFWHRLREVLGYRPEDNRRALDNRAREVIA